MRQSWPMFVLMSALLAAGGCFDRRPAAVTGGIVSLTPAGTDLLIALGLADRVVGVSPYEANASMRQKLPKVGDYLRIDWERLAELRPKFLIVQGKRDRLPPGTREKCKELGITPVILQIDRFGDIEATLRQLGEVTGNAEAAKIAIGDLQRRFEAMRTASANRTPLPALIVFSDSGMQVVGRNNFIDDALTLAGGENVIKADNYPTIDREKLAALRPGVAFLVLAGADAATVERGTTALRESGLSPEARVVPITDVDALMPSTAAYRLAETMAASLKALP